MVDSLLSLPIELRARIIDLVILRHRERPDLNAIESERAKVESSAPEGWSRYTDIMHPTDAEAYETNTKSLLLVNHQLRAETLKQLALRTSQVNYDIDIIIHSRHGLMPTWTFLPVTAQQIDTLTASIRVLPCETPNDYWSFNLRGGPYVTWRLWQMLSTFLQFGASNPPKSPSPAYRRYPIVINRLVIDLNSTPATATGCTMKKDCPVLISDGDRWDSGWTGAQERLVARHPECLADFIAVAIRKLLHATDDTRVYGDPLFSNIGTIELQINGVQWACFSLGDILARIPHGGPHWPGYGVVVEVRFEKWRKATEAQRSFLGLPMGRTEAFRDSGSSTPAQVVSESRMMVHRDHWTHLRA